MKDESVVVHEIDIRGGIEEAFDALARSEQRLKWWGRGGRFRATRMESDLRPGGRWTMSFETPRGPMTVGGEYREVERPRLLGFTWLPSWYEATESLVRVELSQAGGLVRVRLTHSGLAGEADRANNKGWPDLLASLKRHVESA